MTLPIAILRPLLGMLVVLLGLQSAAFAQRSPFYVVSSRDVAGVPGTIIRQVPLRGSPWGSHAYRVVYRSIGLNGAPIAVSGVIVVPDKPPPPEGFPVIAWAHPTTGVADRCAPSRFGAGMFGSIPGLADMVKRGFVVAATDYEGLGIEDLDHPYLVGVSAGRSVIDSVRAAGALTYTSGQFAVWGHSQGGHAALWTAEVANNYAGGLRLAGVAAAAPASLLADLLEDDLGTHAGRGLTAMTVWSWANVFRAPLESVVLPHALSDVRTIGSNCLAGFADLAALGGAVLNLGHAGFLAADPGRTKPWAEIMTMNTPGRTRGGIKVPVYIAQGGRDKIVSRAITERFANGLCSQGVPVTYHYIAEISHKDIDNRAASRAIAWIADRFSGLPAGSNCRGR